MLELIAILVFFVSLIGLAVIVFRKVPVLVELSPQETRIGPLEKIKKEIKKKNPFKSFSNGILLQKILSKARILSLKAESKTSSWLGKLRQRALKQRFSQKGTFSKKNLTDLGDSLVKFSENYWQELKKINRQEARGKKGKKPKT